MEGRDSRVTVRRLVLIALLVAAFAAHASVAFAYQDELPESEWADLPMARPFIPDPDDPGTWTLPDPMPCYFCHGTGTNETTDTPTGRSGPHGGYLATTNKCATCHSVHSAPAGSVLLLPAATAKGTCETCHDGTGGRGVYGVIEARGQSVEASHSIDMTNIIPGGDGATGGSLETTFSGTSGYLTCTDCHSPHGNNVVEPFTGDRARSSVDTTITSSRLLRRRPVSASVETTEYGSDWCGGCHAGRLSHPLTSGANHPVDSSETTDSPFYYEYVARAGHPDTVLGTLGLNNYGYVMPEDKAQPASQQRIVEQRGHYPICQQCHEDARGVGNDASYPQQIAPSEMFSVTTTYSVTLVGDNPEFQTFPHESTVTAFLIEPRDSLCLNCHAKQGSGGGGGP